MNEKYRIAIAEDHTILREGLRALLISEPDFEVVCEAGDGRDAIHCIEKYRPDLVLMDLSMPKMKKLDIHNVATLTAFAMEKGLLSD